MSNVPDYRSTEQAHYETMRELRNRLEQAERQRDEAQGLLEESQRIGVIAPLSWRRRVDAHLRDTGE